MNRFPIGHTSLRVAPTDLRIASIAAVGASDKTAEPPFHDPRAYTLPATRMSTQVP